MQKSESIVELAKALNKFQTNMGIVVFDANNPFFKSRYASLSNIVSSSKIILSDCGLAISQLVENEGGVTTILMHTSGQWLSSTLTLKSVKDDPQGHGSAITYARRYAYASILGIVSDEDDDGNSSTMPQKQAEMPQGDTKKGKTNTSSAKEPEHIKTDLEKPTDDDTITNEQGTALLMMLAKNLYTKQDLLEYAFFEFEIDKLSKICNKHLPKIKEHFSKKKAEVAK